MTITAFAMQSCSSAKPSATVQPQPAPAAQYELHPLAGIRTEQPRAIVYRTSVPCADLVPVQLSPDGRSLISYPAPSDLTGGQSAPVALDGGWWLDRRGIGPSTVFTTYTYAEYSAMAQAPTQADILAHIDRKAYITAMYALPLTAAEAAANPAVCNKYIADGFRDCENLRTFAR